MTIHRSAWKVHSRKFALRCFSEIRLEGVPEVRLGRGKTLRGVFAPSSPMAAGADPGAALWTAPGCREVFGAIVERPVALRAGLETGPTPVLLRREHDQDQSSDGVVQPVRFGGEQFDSARLPG